MYTRAKGFPALFAVAALVAACGGSSAPDVGGGSASDSATLFKASNLNKVLIQAKGQLAGTPVTVLKIEPRDVKIVGQNKTVTVDSSGKSVVIGTPSIPGEGTFDLGVVSPATVQSVIGAVGSKSSLKQSDIAYVTVTVDPINHRPIYGVYPVSGDGHYQANINGGSLKAFGGSGGGTSGGSAAPSGGSAAPSGGSSGGGGGDPQAIANCISKAGSDVAKVQKCAGG
jgi:hypothetical protein